MALDPLSSLFSALADPTRRAILAMLALGPQPVGEIAKPFQMTEPAVIKHLKVLEKAGLIQTDRQGQSRPRTLRAEPLREAFDWVAHYRKYWEPSFDELEELLNDLQSPLSEDQNA